MLRIRARQAGDAAGSIRPSTENRIEARFGLQLNLLSSINLKCGDI